MSESDYFSSRVTDADNTWQELPLAESMDRAFKSIVIINDNDSLELQVRLNDMLNNIIYIPGGEGIALDKPAYRMFYLAASGNPSFRVMAD
jgi:hypothetical protein